MLGSEAAMGDWIPLMDYAIKKGVSLSTLRRHIKANKIRYKVENGRYLLPLDGNDDLLEVSAPISAAPAPLTSARPAAAPAVQVQGARDQTVAELQQLVQKMALDLQRAREEIVELKTLIAFYEDTVNSGNV